MAKGWFSLPLNGSMRSRSAAHRSFAGLGIARILVATAAKEDPSKISPLVQAAAVFEASLKEYPKGSWHDETLRGLALLIERSAAEQFGPPPAEKAGDKKIAGKPPTPPTNTAGQPQKKTPISDAARQREKKALTTARAQALPYWSDLSDRYSTSRYMPQALYHAGVLYTETEKPDKALAAFEELAKKYPDSPWTGDAHVRLIDVKLERQFDLPGARDHAEAAVAWYEHLDQAKAAQARKGIGEEQSDALRSAKQLGYDIYVRAGLVEYLLEHPEHAIGFFEKAKPLQPERNYVEANGHIPTGIERLIEAAKMNKSLTPEVVRQGDERAKMILMLADVYHEGQQHDKSLDLCTRVVAGSAPKATREQKSYAYFRRARNHYLIVDSLFDPNAALADYVAAVAASPKSPWADSAMLLAGNVEWNDKHNAGAAIAVWRRLLKEYPKSSEADRCAFFIGVAHFFSKQYPEAEKALQEFMVSYPDSEFADSAKDILAKCNAQIDGARNRR